ncbi:MAG: PorT family protein, partial [Eudoraea sp.]|nr:PorT family protein [Eudoraea sp.]
MKKLLFISMIGMFTLLTSCTTMRYGVKAGPTFATLTGDDTDNLDAKIGFFFGGLAELEVTDMFSVQPELLFSSQGTKYSESDGFDGKLKFNYLNLPVMAKVYVSDGFFFEAGPQLGYLLSAKDEYESPGLSGEDDLKDEGFVKDIDVGANIGLGYQLDSGLNIGARYNFGLTNINDLEDSGDFSIK